MKKTLYIYASVLSFLLSSEYGNSVFAQFPPQHRTISVLFIGNSYTYVNDLPLLIDSLAAANGDTLIYSQSTPGGYSFEQHASYAPTISLIYQQPWDYVILQEQSQRPSLDSAYVDANVIPYLLQLDSMIHDNNSCTQVILYMTWGRKNGDASNCAFYPPVCTYAGMQQRLKESYLYMADTIHAVVAPVGEAFRAYIQFDSTLNLYNADESHPSLEGSYLAGCVFNKILYKHKFNTGTFYAGINPTTAINLQLIAETVVTDSLGLWNLGIEEPWAAFAWHEINSSGLAEFTPTSDSTFTHFWDFGDNQTSTDPHPFHQYTWSQYFPVLHIVCDSCRCDTFQLTTNIVGNSMAVNEFNSGSAYSIFPNPVTTIATISSGIKRNSAVTIIIDDLTGKEFLRKDFKVNEAINLDLQNLTPGFFLVKIINEHGIGLVKLVKSE